MRKWSVKDVNMFLCRLVYLQQRKRKNYSDTLADFLIDGRPSTIGDYDWVARKASEYLTN